MANYRMAIRIAITLIVMNVANARAELIYGSAAVGNGSIWQIDTSSFVASQMSSNIGVTPNSLATNSAANMLYFGDNAGTTLWRFDLSSSTTTQIYDMAPHVSGLTNPTFGDGGSFYNGSYYLLVQSDLPGGDAGSVNTLLEATMSLDGTSVTGVIQHTVNTPGGIPLGDLGDFAINKQGILHGNSWDPPGGDTQVGGYWTLNVNDPGNSFTIVQDTTPLGFNQPTYQLAFNGDRSTLLGLDFFTTSRLDVLDYTTNPVGITAQGNLTGFSGTQFVDLSSAMEVPEPSSIFLCGAAGLLALSFGGRRREAKPNR